MTDQNRIHPLDNLRGILAAIGIPFHAAFYLYMADTLLLKHPITKPNQFLLEPVPTLVHSVLLIFFYLQTFWMPGFFLIAGFSAHLLYHKNIRYFLKNRLRRIGLPFLFYFLWLIPCFLFKLFLQSLVQHKTFQATLEASIHNNVLWAYFNNTASYWFLEYLLWIYAITLVIVLFKNFVLRKKQGDHLFVRKRWLLTLFIYIVLPATCASLFLQGNYWFIMLSNHLMPSVPLLLFYSLWYFIGWFFWENQILLAQWGAHAIQKIFASILLYILYLICYFHFIRAQTEWLHLLSVYIYSLSMSMGIFGLIGIAWRYLPTHQTVLRYLSKASYWLYLTQVPVIWYLSWIMVSVTENFYIQFFSIVLLCFAFSLLTYHLFIRRTRLQKIVG